MTNNYKYSKDYLLEHTDKGLDVVKRLFPKASEVGNKKFKISNEDTPSANIIPSSYTTGESVIVKDFSSGESYDCFALVELVEPTVQDFADACKWIAKEFNLGGEDVQFNTAKLEVVEAKEDEQHGDCDFVYNDKLTTFELSVLGPLVTNETAALFNLKSCKSFSRVLQFKDHHKYGNKKMKFINSSTDTYPILVFDNETWQKIYQPLNEKKQYRFSYAGDKPENYVFGLDDLVENFEQWQYENTTDEDEFPLHKYIIIGSGDRDSLNISSLGYPVVWLNSETANLDYKTFETLSSMTENLCYCGDLDATGVRETIKLSLQFIQIKIIWLPEWLSNLKYRGKSQKDVTDYCKAVFKKENPDMLRSQFKKLVNTALPSQFWIVKQKNDGSFNGYEFDNEACYRFLQYNGFYRYQEDTEKDDFSFIHVENGIIERKKTHEVSNFPIDYLRHTNRPISLLNYVHRTGQLTEKKLATLKHFKADFKNAGPNYQRYFFENEVWTVTPTEITKERYKDLQDVYVWKDHILPHNVTIAKNKIFEITEDAAGVYDVEIKNKDNHFLNYLINTSRVHWKDLGEIPYSKKIAALNFKDPDYHTKKAEILEQRKQYRLDNKFNISETNLPKEKQDEQKHHLVSKIYAIGYLLHQHKVKSKAWAVIAMDHKISELGQSNGGTGKSITIEDGITQILRSNYTIDGKKKDVEKDNHLYGSVTKYTDYLALADGNSRFDYESLFNRITGPFAVNPKGSPGFNIPFEDSPKIGITTNHAIYDANASMLRRLLFVLYSDYYHYKGEDYLDDHSVRDDFDKDLFADFTSAEWSDFFNFCMQALQFFLSTDNKIQAPLNNVNKRNALQTIGATFRDWADQFFSNNLNQDIVKEEVYENLLEYYKKIKIKSPSKTIFKKKLKGWCDYKGYEFNPIDVCNNGNRIIRSGNIEEIHVRSSNSIMEGIEDDPANGFEI
jgi:hypothetical protein